MSRFVTFLALLAVFCPVSLQAQSTAAARSGPLPPDATGEDIYRAACITCHGEDGKGGRADWLGNVAPPDFTDCAFASAEADADWHSVVHEGGPIRGLDHHMPAFGDALSMDQITLAVSHVRTFCAERAWPQGDLNFPRAFFTEKAFPENEYVWTTALTGTPNRAIANELVYERRLGPRNQIEIVAPIDFIPGPDGARVRGLGDLAFAFRRTFYASMRTGGIGAAGLEVALPTGKESLGLGNGFSIIEPFAMWGQMLPRNSFLQLHGGLEVPSDGDKGEREAYLRTAIGTTIAVDRGFGRAWSPQVEVLWARPEGGASEWDVVPQLQVSLSKIQHVVIAGGVRIPVNEREERRTQALLYLLWDWFDGGFFKFWK
jgi:mono/diheme cytochrome c family protein